MANATNRPDDYYINTSEIIEDFHEHIKPEHNKRILFSAPFGAGKTSFLEEFFKKEEEYIPVKLYPVDYSVSSNEDIFELIKHDLLVYLMENFSPEIALEKQDIDMLVAGKMWLDSQLDIFPFLPALAKLVPGSDTITEFTAELKNTFHQIVKHRADLGQDELEVIIKYLAQERLRSGSIRELDGITGRIKEFIQRIRQAKQGKKIILVIDDMDRLDPDHIFRLFNIFTAHHESQTEENKFGFDKVIFVCDIVNIHHIFVHKYGPLVDFQGYINKFYSTVIYKFDFREFLSENLASFFIKNVMKNMVHDIHTSANSIANISSREPKFAETLQYMMKGLITIDSIKVRNFTKLSTYEYPMGQFRIVSGRTFHDRDFPFLVLIHVLRQFYPRIEDLTPELLRLSKEFNSDYGQEEEDSYDDASAKLLIQWAVPFITPDYKVLDKIGKFDNIKFQIVNEHNKLVNGELSRSLEGNYFMKKLATSSLEGRLYIKRPNPYWYLHQALINCLKNGIVRD
ncbi:P-loop NTPase fold protein [Pedobacter frigidisoli]|uniref:P-loop NTPase fold protein n=1 Tax=Pedobacter frigidisoli TaxID=2530455 RepID=UPI00292FC514|nr:P-loop NTPase fold protein [Pedobacter frigidisoli]